jgi:hypothetical protein
MVVTSVIQPMEFILLQKDGKREQEDAAGIRNFS